MIKFFRKIRQRLLMEQKTAQYLKYAIGEIILVVIGILIALELNNWNEERKRKENYRATIEQIYNSLELETQELQSYIKGLLFQQRYADSLYNNPDLLPIEQIPGLLFYMETEPNQFTSSIGFHLQNMEVNPKDKRENLLARSLTNYLSTSSLEPPTGERPLSAILTREGIPSPALFFGYSLSMGMIDNPEFLNFNEKDWEKAKKLVQTLEIKMGLAQLAQGKEFLKGYLVQLNDMATNSMSQIENIYPDVRFRYENIGLIGEGTKYEDWINDISLTLTDDQNSIWETIVELNGKGVKLRENKNWIVNWGGFTFPKGSLEWNGPNIPCEKGTFRLIVNLKEKTYEFIPVSN